ncbi:hypothetical protein Mp_7g09210 [Marchantia polymorpha subsp. ruderalis]|uniref:Uncharacterized protein n=2 Tax=Marchantia polymorpha TaxID=3197 RepID=A0AAF6BXP3_MARPO|nr:hypothetical protein MARPO_0068s0074 [Marchantia polymorpha]BBN16777.1 hypothetical protein Mp_7g09210 [Marchantia polymorpha subsp. ruderalis]|eukprot:PTQ35860.1 hypothetical protein MARPO_0068s0074 [Marchantia polymorpha]
MMVDASSLQPIMCMVRPLRPLVLMCVGKWSAKAPLRTDGTGGAFRASVRTGVGENGRGCGTRGEGLRPGPGRAGMENERRERGEGICGADGSDERGTRREEHVGRGRGAAGDGTGEGSPGKCGTAQRGGGRTPARDSSLGSGRNVHDRRRDARLAQFVLTDCPAWAGWAGLVTVCGEHLPASISGRKFRGLEPRRARHLSPPAGVLICLISGFRTPALYSSNHTRRAFHRSPPILPAGVSGLGPGRDVLTHRSHHAL